jgi:hypothetical protein
MELGYKSHKKSGKTATGSRGPEKPDFRDLPLVHSHKNTKTSVDMDNRTGASAFGEDRPLNTPTLGSSGGGVAKREGKPSAAGKQHRPKVA